MSARELTRVGALARAKAGTLTVTSAAQLLHVGYCQAKRLVRRYRAHGAKGGRDRRAGRRSNHAPPATERTRILALVRKKHSGSIDERCGPTLAAGHLAREDGTTVHPDTLRRWIEAYGVPLAPPPAPVRRPVGTGAPARRGPSADPPWARGYADRQVHALARDRGA